MRVEEIARLINGTVQGNGETVITDVKKIEEAGQGDISFIANPKYAKYAETTGASALIVNNEFQTNRDDIAYIKVEDSYKGFIKILGQFAPSDSLQGPGIHPTAVVAEDLIVDDTVSIGANVFIDKNCKVGKNVVIMPNVVIGAEVEIGDGTVLYPNVTIYPKTILGANVIIHSGSVIGSDGFGFIPDDNGAWEKIPQIGRVVIEDSVEIGVNVAIDRGTMGETHIGHGVKLDNLIHIAHNVVIGENTVIAAQTGIAGSTKIGLDNMIAGQVGIVGHIETADDVIIEAQSGVSKSIRKAGRYFGHPAKEHAIALRQEGALRQLPDLLAEIRDMRARIEKLETALGKEENSL